MYVHVCASPVTYKATVWIHYVGKYIIMCRHTFKHIVDTHSRIFARTCTCTLVQYYMSKICIYFSHDRQTLFLHLYIHVHVSTHAYMYMHNKNKLPDTHTHTYFRLWLWVNLCSHYCCHLSLLLLLLFVIVFFIRWYPLVVCFSLSVRTTSACILYSKCIHMYIYMYSIAYIVRTCTCVYDIDLHVYTLDFFYNSLNYV